MIKYLNFGWDHIVLCHWLWSQVPWEKIAKYIKAGIENWLQKTLISEWLVLWPMQNKWAKKKSYKKWDGRTGRYFGIVANFSQLFGIWSPHLLKNCEEKILKRSEMIYGHLICWATRWVKGSKALLIDKVNWHCCTSNGYLANSMFELLDLSFKLFDCFK